MPEVIPTASGRKGEKSDLSNQNCERRCGFVAVIGPPNVGKSTLVNRLTGARVSIVTAKPQTTRNRVMGLVVVGLTQIILLDTPGFFAPRSGLDHAMLSAARRSVSQADAVLFLVDAKADPGGAERAVKELRDTTASPIMMLVLNKIDRVARPSLLALAQSFNRWVEFEKTFMISALYGDGVDDMTGALASALPLGPWLFPEDQITDAPQRVLASELTREQVFLRLRQELPYAAAVETETWQEFSNGDLRLEQIIIVERETQKGIVIGKAGGRIKEIGAAARREIASVFGRKVHLFLRVKVRPGWREDPRYLRALGLEISGA